MTIGQSCPWADKNKPESENSKPEPGLNPKMQARTQPKPENNLKL